MSFLFSAPIQFWDETRTIGDVSVASLSDLLAKSNATQAFKDGVLQFYKENQANAAVRLEQRMPPIKAFRVLMKLL